MSTIIWGVIALVLLFVLSLFAKNRFDLSGKTDIFNVDDLMSGGVVGCLFGIIVFPFILVYSWIWPDVPLPVEGDDPIWGRNVNKKVVEGSFLAIQHARETRNAKPLKEEIWDEIYRRVKRECDKLAARGEIYLPQAIKIDDIRLSNERIDKESVGNSEYVYYRFEANIIGSMISALKNESDGTIVAGTAKRIEFDASMSFEGSPGNPFGGWLLMKAELPRQPNH